jgi:hypothetical protein
MIIVSYKNKENDVFLQEFIPSPDREPAASETETVLHGR